MRKLFILVILAGLGSFIYPQSFQPSIAKSIKVLEYIQIGQFDSVEILMDHSLRDKTKGNLVEKGWNDIHDIHGKYLYLSDIEYDDLQKNEIVYLTCQFEKGTSHLKLTWNEGKQLSGLYFLPYKPLIKTGKLNHFLIFLILIAWELIWKAIALWKAAQRKEKYWFGAIFLLLTIGILPIIYLAINSKSGK